MDKKSEKKLEKQGREGMVMKDVYLVLGKRTPQAKAGMDLKDVSVPYLGTGLIRDILNRTQVPEDSIDEVIVGNTGAPAKYPNVARVIALESGLDKKISSYTVHRNCASGMEALSQGYLKIASGRSDLIFAGGVESMSQMPLMFSKELTEIILDAMKAKTVGGKLKAFSSFRFPHLSPVVAIEQGLTDPFCGLNMGETAELLSREMGITRLQQDEFANQSHLKAAAAEQEGRFKEEIVPLIVGESMEKLLSHDVGPRANSSVEGLGKMRPYFDRKSGTVTVGNACPVTDGGSFFLMASEEAVKKYNLEPMARMVDYYFHGLEPERMGLGPALAMSGIFRRTKLGMQDMDLVEINEAFAAQVLAVRMLLREKKWSEKWGIDEVIGDVPDEILNVNGGGIALGHPVGSTGCRLVVTLAHELRRRKARYGIASLCIGGGQGGAMIIENLQK